MMMLAVFVSKGSSYVDVSINPTGYQHLWFTMRICTPLFILDKGRFGISSKTIAIQSTCLLMLASLALILGCVGSCHTDWTQSRVFARRDCHQSDIRVLQYCFGKSFRIGK